MIARARAYCRSYLGGEAVFPIVVLFLLNSVDEFDNRIFEVLGPDIAKAFDTDVATFTGLAVFAALIVPLIALPVARLADTRSRMGLAIIGAACWGTFSFATGFAPSLALLFVARAGSGMGKTVNGPVHSALIGDFYSPATRAKVFGLHSLANPIGGVVAAVGAGFLADAFGWRVPFLVFALPSLAVLFIARRLPEPERGRHERIEQQDALAWRDAIRYLWTLRSLRYQWWGAAWAAGSIFGIGVILPFVLEDEFNASAGTRGLINGVGQVIAVFATLAGTAIMQRRVNEQPSAGLRLLCWAGTIAGGALVVAAACPNLATFLIPTYVVIAVFAFVVPGLASITALVAPPELRSMAFAVGGVIALSGLPFALVGGLVGNTNVRWALVVMAPIFLRGVGFFFQAAQYLDDDIARLDPNASHRDPAGADVLLLCRDVTAAYGPVQVLFGIDLEVRRGEIVALLGTNGSGKSTILNVVSGLLEPTGGNVWFDGDYVTGERPERMVARGLVQAPGGKGVFPALSVEENLRMAGFLLRRDTAELDRRITEVMTLFPRLAERRGQRAGDLSGGERQMLTIAGSFLLRPKLLMIDELSLGLAPAVVQELLVAVRAMAAAGTTILLVEQSVNVALTLADRAYFLEKGEVRFDGRTADLLKRDDLVRSVFLEGAAKSVRRR